MQFASLSSGSFSEWLLIMGAFSLGTFPMLALLSFGATGFSHSRFSGIFFRTSWVVVIGLGLFSLLTGLASLWVIPPLFNL
jgi:sulfite exporter TauE/SafE